MASGTSRSIGQFLLTGQPRDPFPKGVVPSIADGKAHGLDLHQPARPADPPAKMSRPRINPLNSYAVSISWTPPADFAAQRRALGATDPPHPQLMGYQIRYGLSETGGKMIDLEQKWNALTTRAVLKHLEGGQKYFFQVAAFNEVGSGDWSDPSEVFHMPHPDHDDEFLAKTATDRSLDITQSLKKQPKKRPLLSSHAPDAIDVSWEKPCDRGSKIVAYDILYSTDEDFEDDFGTLRVDGSATKARLTDLEPNTTYFFKHRAVNEVGCSNWSATSSGISTTSKPPEPPDPPRLESTKSFSLKIAWDHPRSYRIPVKMYRVRFSTKGSMDKAIELPVPQGPLTPNGDKVLVQSMRVEGLRPLTDYFFQVLALNQIGHSLWSKPSSPMRTKASAPAQCEAPIYIDATKDEITLEWDPPDSYGSPIDRYDVKMSKHRMFQDTPIEYKKITYKQVGGKVQACIPNCFPPGEPHYFGVRASGPVGFGGWSESSEVMYTKPTRPEAPNAPTKFRALPRAIVVNWEAPKDNGDPITQYRLRYDTTSDMRNCLECSGLKGSLTWHAVTSLLPHTSHFFQVCAKNGIGWSDWSLPSRPVQVVQEPPAKPGAPYRQGGTRQDLKVAFTVPADVGTKDGTTIHGYTLRYSTDQSLLSPQKKTEDVGGADAVKEKEDPNIKVVENAQSPVSVRGLIPGVSYYFQVHASNQFGRGEWSDISEAMQTDPSVPEPPKPPVKVERTAWSIVLQWTPPSDNGSKIVKYLVRVLDEQMKGEPRDLHPIEHVEFDMRNGIPMQHYNATGLLPGTRYRFQVAAVNSCGRSDWSDATGPFQTEPTAPNKSGRPEKKATGKDFFEVTWSAPRDNGEAITEYEAQYTEVMGQWDGKNVTIVKTKERSLRVEDRVPGFTYYVRVFATNAIGDGPISDVGTVRCDPWLPSTPGKPKVDDIGPISVHLTWVPCYDGGERLTGYKVKYMNCDDPKEGGEIDVQGLRRGLDVTGLESGRGYIFRLAAVNKIGQSDWSNPTDAIYTLPPLCPSKTGAPYLLKATAFSLEVAWMPAEKNGAEILEQILQYSTDPEFKNEEQTKRVSISGMQSRRTSQLMPEAENTSELEKDSGVAGLIFRMKKLKEQRKTIEGFEPSTTYYFAVTSRNCIGASPVSDVSEGFTTMPYRPHATGSIDLAGADATWLRFSWTTPHDNGAAVHTYKLAYSKNKDGLLRMKTKGQLAYEAATQAEKDKAGDKEKQIDKVEQEDEEHDEEDDVQQITLTSKELDSILAQDKHGFQIDGLEPGVGYYASVKAINDVGASPWTMLGHMVQTRAMEPTGMKVCTPVSQTESSVTVGWEKPLPRGSEIHAYELCWVTREYLSLDPWRDIKLGDTVTLRFDPYTEPVVEPRTYEVKGLLPGTSVRVMARAQNEIGWSVWNDCTPEEVPEGFVSLPMPPLDPKTPRLVEGSLQAHAMQLKFEVGRPNGTPNHTFHFRIAEDEAMTEAREWKESVENPSYYREGTFFTFSVSTDQGLLPGTSYWFQVVQENACGLSGWSPVSQKITTLPDCPKQPLPPYSDITTPSTIEVKWFPPHDNGAPILGYMLRFRPPPTHGDIKKEDIENTPTVDISEETIGMAECVYELSNLLPGRRYYFELRCRNEVGWSNWSQISRGFVTKPTRPDAPTQVDCVKTTPKIISIEWNKPDEHGAEISQYEVVCSQSSVLLKWMYFTSKITARTVDISALFPGSEEQAPIGTVYGAEDLKKIHSEGAFLAILPADKLSYSFEGLVPGRTYHATIRAKNSAGKGNWSVPLGPLRTKSSVPSHVQKFEPVRTDNSVCSFAFTLPYDNGERIDQCIVQTTWLNGPTADHEKDPLTRKPHPHIKNREDTFDPWACEPLEGGDQPVYKLQNLLPGTDYEVKWCAANSLGRGIFSPPVVITTLSNVPDVPSTVNPHSHE